MKRNLLTLLLTILSLSSCKHETLEAVELRKVPEPLDLPAPTQSDFLPEAKLAGGGAMPIADALSLTNPASSPDATGRLWVKSGAAPMRSDSTLKDSHYFVVLKSEKSGIQGLLGGSDRNWDNFVSFAHADNGVISFSSENRSGKASKTNCQSQPPISLDSPWLLEVHPAGDAAKLFVNSTAAGAISANCDVRVFGRGYANQAAFSGLLGEIRVYDSISEAQTNDIRKLLTCWWELDGTSLFANHARLNPAILGGTCRAARSGKLTIVCDAVPAEYIGIGATPRKPAEIDSLPKGMSIVLGQIWVVTPEGGSTKTEANFCFSQSDTLTERYLGEHGFYALLHRPAASGEWSEIASTSATKDGRINFPKTQLKAGEYTLGVVQGIQQEKNNAFLTINGNKASNTLTIPAGQLIRLGVSGAKPDQKLELVERQSGATWYSGPAAKLDLPLRLLRDREISLIASYSAGTGVQAGRSEVNLKLDEASDSLYPGVLAQIVPWREQKLPDAGDISAHASWPEQSDTGEYPAYRTAASIHTPDFKDPSKAWWTPPHYFHNILPILDLTTDRGEIIERRSFPAYPLGDLGLGRAIMLSGELLLPTTGEYSLKVVTNQDSTFSINGQVFSCAANSEITCTFQTGSTTPLPFSFISMAAEGAPKLDLQILWKVPSATDFSAIPANALVHGVSKIREEALAGVTNKFSYRDQKFTRSVDDGAAVKLLADFNAAAHGATTAEFSKSTRMLAVAFLHGRELSQDPKAAQAVFEIISARIDTIRKDPKQLSLGGFGKTDGRLVETYEFLRGFFTACENLPTLQEASLNARSELAQYTIATCLNRSFFGEGHHGANDGYSDNDNLLVNFWRAARCLDDPYAWDAATCLQDSHFRYGSVRNEALSSDGMFTFHNVNGRQMHPLGYGTSWFNRIMNRVGYGTPWSYTREQYRRLAEYLLANEWIFYHGTQSWGANGRHNTHRGSGAGFAGPANVLSRLPEGAIRPEDRKDMQQLVARLKAQPENSITGNRFFYRNLLMVHRRDDYYIDVKMTSPLVGTAESFAGQVSWNMSFGDGVTTFMRSGKEFNGLHTNNGPNPAYGIIRGHYKNPQGSKQIPNLNNPTLWFFRSLAGTTKLDDEVNQPDRYRGGYGATAGGVSDGTLGSCGFHFHQAAHGAGARKFYAFTDDGLVVLNSDVTALRGAKVPETTTVRSNINQCDWKTDIRVTAQDGRELVIKQDAENQDLTFPLNQRYWIEQDGIGYLIIPTGAEAGEHKPGTLRLQATLRTPYTEVPGFKYNKDQTELIRKTVLADRKTKVFHLWIDHGQQVSGGKCSYFVCMRSKDVPVKEWLAAPPVSVLANQTNLQAITDKRDGVTHAFFREAGELRDTDGKLLFSAPAPVALMWRPATHSVTVQDPVAACTTDLTKMADTMKPTLGTGLRNLDTERALEIMMPGANDPDDRYRGRPVTYPVK